MASRQRQRSVPAERLENDPFAALGDANRRAIIEVLSRGERSVQDISAELPISRPAVSRHLRLLREAGLVVDKPSGNKRLYALDVRGVDAIREYMAGVWGEASARFRLVAENTRDVE
jgi:DNA-binding transcriptional ArsR family regulator